MAVVVRRLTPADAEALRRLRMEALEREPTAFSEAPNEASTRSLDQTAERLRATDSFVVGAFLADALIGMIGVAQNVGRKKRHKADIWGVYVTKSVRRQGIAKQLLVEALAHAQALPGLRHVTLSVSVDQSEAIALYRQAGFTEYGREPNALAVEGRFLDYLLMWRKV